MATQPDTQIIDLSKMRGVELSDRTDIMINSALARLDLTDHERAFCLAAMKGVRDYATESEYGLKRVADQIDGMSNGVLSQMFGGTYPGNYMKRCQKLANFLAARETARIYGRIDSFVPTRIGQGLERLLERTRYNHRIQTLQSPEQLGKTRVCREYVQRENSRTIMVTLEDSGTSNPFSLFLRDLAEACGISTDHKPIMHIRGLITRYLDNIDLVVVDEWHATNDWPDRAIKALLDFIRKKLHADGKRGVILIATNDDINASLDGFRVRTRYNMGQLYGRMCNEPFDIDPGDISLSDVQALVERYYKPGKRTLKKLHEVSLRENLGHFGFLLDVMDQAWADHVINDQPLSDQLVEERLESSLEAIAERENNK